MRVPPEQRGQQGPGPAADIDDGADVVPAAAEFDVEVGDAMSSRSHERVEFRRDRRMGGQVLPEWQPEHLLVGRLARADVVEQRPPGMSHPSADAIEVQEACPDKLVGGPVAGEPAGRFLGEHSSGDEMTEDGMEGVAVTPRCRGEFGDASAARGNMFGDVQGRGHVEAPGGGQVKHPPEVHGGVIGGAFFGGAFLGRVLLGRVLLGRVLLGRVLLGLG